MEAQDLLLKLEATEEFQLWRDEVAKPIIEQLKGDLKDPCMFSEADLKAKVMHLNFVEGLFYRLFENVRVSKELES